jgi:hypothetical protein
METPKHETADYADSRRFKKLEFNLRESAESAVKNQFADGSPSFGASLAFTRSMAFAATA